MRRKPWSEHALPTKQQHEDHAADNRRHRERQVDKRYQQVLASELEFRDRPGGGDPKDRIEWHNRQGGQQSQPDGRQRFRFADRRPIASESQPQSFGEHHNQRQEQEEKKEAQSDGDEQSARAAALGKRQRAARGLRRIRATTRYIVNHLAASGSTPAAG